MWGKEAERGGMSGKKGSKRKGEYNEREKKVRINDEKGHEKGNVWREYNNTISN
jgi:hypothetical protein